MLQSRIACIDSLAKVHAPDLQLRVPAAPQQGPETARPPACQLHPPRPETRLLRGLRLTAPPSCVSLRTISLEISAQTAHWWYSKALPGQVCSMMLSGQRTVLQAC